MGFTGILCLAHHCVQHFSAPAQEISECQDDFSRLDAECAIIHSNVCAPRYPAQRWNDTTRQAIGALVEHALRIECGAFRGELLRDVDRRRDGDCQGATRQTQRLGGEQQLVPLTRGVLHARCFVDTQA